MSRSPLARAMRAARIDLQRKSQPLPDKFSIANIFVHEISLAYSEYIPIGLTT